jgi:hypothetical protein
VGHRAGPNGSAGGLSSGQQSSAFGRKRTVVREDLLSAPVGCLLWSGVLQRGENGRCSSRLDAETSVVPLSLWVSMAVEGSTGTVDCCLESTRVRLLTYPCPPRDGHQPNVSSQEGQGHGIVASAMCRDRHLEEGRED